MVGGLDGTMLGTVIASQFGIAGNWPYGAALAVILLISVATLLLVVFRLARVPGVLVGEGGSPPIDNGPFTLARRFWGALGFVAFCIPYLFLYAPLVVIAILSFNTAEMQAFPMSGWTFRWYEELASNSALLTALARSLAVGILVLLIAIAVGTSFAILFALGRVRASRWVEGLLLLPVAIPGVVLGITLVLTFQLLSVPVGIPRVVLGHATFVMPVVMMIVLGRLRRLDPALVEALGRPRRDAAPDLLVRATSTGARRRDWRSPTRLHPLGRRGRRVGLSYRDAADLAGLGVEPDALRFHAVSQRRLRLHWTRDGLSDLPVA